MNLPVIVFLLLAVIVFIIIAVSLFGSGSKKRKLNSRSSNSSDEIIQESNRIYQNFFEANLQSIKLIYAEEEVKDLSQSIRDGDFFL